MLISICKRVLFAGLATISFVASAQEVTSPLLQLQHQWAHVNYNLEGDAQHDAFISLIEDAKQLAEKAQNNASSLTWLAISQSSAASAKGGLGALDYAKNAKDNLERAIEKDASVLEGTALTVLAALYHKVPGWPVSFGSDTEAEELFKRALEVNPNGMDQNFFYAEFLFEEGDYELASKHIEIAAASPAKQNRPLADKMRKREIAELQKRIAQKR